jgi:uncharacterized protein YlbG (UPF0298 family)
MKKMNKYIFSYDPIKEIKTISEFNNIEDFNETKEYPEMFEKMKYINLYINNKKLKKIIEIIDKKKSIFILEIKEINTGVLFGKDGLYSNYFKNLKLFKVGNFSI